MRAYKIAVSLFVCLNIGSVLFMNRPGPVTAAADRFLRQRLESQTAYGFRYAGWLIHRYAHLVGLDNRWQMFGRLSRFNWHYLIQARTADGRHLVLPLPLQSDRTFFQKTFVDFKETKFHHNMYLRQHDRRAYAAYLCRQFPAYKGSPVEAIVIELFTQDILPPDEAVRRRATLSTEVVARPLDTFPCHGS